MYLYNSNINKYIIIFNQFSKKNSQETIIDATNSKDAYTAA